MGKSQKPLAWVVSVEKTKRRKPTDKAVLEMVSKAQGLNESEPTGDLEKKLKIRRPSPLVRGEEQHVVAWAHRCDMTIRRVGAAR
jgi:hypothetical protein